MVRSIRSHRLTELFHEPVPRSTVTPWGITVTTTIHPPMKPWFLALARSGFFSVWLLLVLAACSDTNPTPPRAGAANCTVGATAPCACTDGRLGAQTCLFDHSFGECMCDG